MTEHSCIWMIRQIRRLGYAKKLAEFMARFFCLDEILVWAVAGVLAVFPVADLPLTTGQVTTGSENPAGRGMWNRSSSVVITRGSTFANTRAYLLSSMTSVPIFSNLLACILCE